MNHVPEAPLPPPPHFPPQYSPQHLPAEMERLNLDYGVPSHSGHNGPHNPPADRGFIGPAHHYEPGFPFKEESKIFATHEGWDFAKQPAFRPNEKETWALVVRTPMRVTQTELREHVMKQKKKGKSATEQLASSDMNGFKRRQVERLIADRTQTDPDTKFQYKLGALRLVQKGTKRQGRQTVSMQVILKRQLRNGFAQPPSHFDRRQELDGEVVDLTGVGEAIYSNDVYSTDSSTQYPIPHHPQIVGERSGAPYIHDPRLAGLASPHPGGPQVHPTQQVPEEFQPHHLEMHPFPPEAFQTPDIGIKKNDYKDKHSKHQEKAQVHQKKDKKHKSFSDSSSASSSDDDSFTYTDRTPDTEISGGSGNKYHKDKKHHSSPKEDRRDSRSHDRDRSPSRKVYRERRRRSPTGSSRQGSTRYVYDDYEITTPERHHDRDRAYKPSRRPSQYHKHERPSFHPGAQSFDDDRHHRPSYGTQRRLQSYAHPSDRYAEKEELKWEITEIKKEKLRQEIERERGERDRLELKRLERERLEMEVERERQERDRAERDRLDRLDRERFDKERFDRDRMERGRYDRDRFDRSPYAEPPRRYQPAYDFRRDDPYY